MIELAADELIETIEFGALQIDSTAEVKPLRGPIAQERAMEAIKLSMSMTFDGYNLYALGSTKTDKRTIIIDELQKYAAERPQPSDYCYLQNFNDPAQPLLVELPGGEGKNFKHHVQEFVANVRVMIPAAFESEEYRQASKALTQDFQKTQSQDAAELEKEALDLDLAMLPSPNGFVFAPIADGKVIEQEQFIALSDQERAKFQEAITLMTNKLVERLRDYPARQQELMQAQQALRKDAARKVIKGLLAGSRLLYEKSQPIISFFDHCEQDLIDNLDKMVDGGDSSALLSIPGLQNPESFFLKFEVNLFVDSSDLGGAPVIYESNPSLENLVGKLDHRFEYGNPVTDFTQVRAGALQRANGGYLVLDAERLITKPFAWDALKRALTDHQVRIESVSQLLNVSYSVSLEPESVPLSIKVILLGSHRLYYLLRYYDPDFDDLFKIVADFADHVNWDQTSIEAYVGLLSRIVIDTGVRHLDLSGIKRLLQYCSREVEDRERLSTHVSDIRDLVLEADYVASQGSSSMITAQHVIDAINKRTHRMDRFRELVRENISRGVIRVETTGKKVGQVNGLSVVNIGQMRFGQPSRITATARLGRGEVIDIEREAHLGGDVHSKAVMIVASYIGSKYARDFPLSLQASLVFEQAYAGVEGDSASVAEVCALLSAISGIAIKQSIAITGSMDQHGSAQAVGGVNEKIEGFFWICQEQGLSGEHGVIIPAANKHHLMLGEDVVEAVQNSQFHIYTMDTVDDAIQILLGDKDDPSLSIQQIDAAVVKSLENWHEKAKAAMLGNQHGDA